jgi:hypothetical protein
MQRVVMARPVVAAMVDLLAAALLPVAVDTADLRVAALLPAEVDTADLRVVVVTADLRKAVDLADLRKAADLVDLRPVVTAAASVLLAADFPRPAARWGPTWAKTSTRRCR